MKIKRSLRAALVIAAVGGSLFASHGPGVTAAVAAGYAKIDAQQRSMSQSEPPSNAELTQLETQLPAVIRDVGSYWSKRIDRPWSVTYVVLRPGAAVRSLCSDEPVDAFDGPFYCVSDDRIYLPLGFLVNPLRGYGPAAVAVTVAHEAAHSVQTDVFGGIGRPVEQWELQADCYAGSWMRDYSTRVPQTSADIIAAGTWTYDSGDDAFGDPNHHGTSQQRMGAFFRGFDGWRCDALGDF